MFKYEVECRVNNKLGIHARPSLLIVKRALAETNDKGGIFLKRKDDGRVASASSITEVMVLGASFNVELVVYTNDKRYKEGVDKVAHLISNMQNFE